MSAITDHLDLALGLVPDLVRRLRAHRAVSTHEHLAEGALQLPEFVSLVDGVALDHTGPLHVRAGAVPQGFGASYLAGGWFRPADNHIDHLLDAYSCGVAAHVGPGGGEVVVRRLADPLYDAEQSLGRLIRKGLFVRVPGVTHVSGRNAAHDAIVWNGELAITSQVRWSHLDPRTLQPLRSTTIGEALGPTTASLQRNMHPQVDPATGRLVSHAYEVGPTFTTTFTFVEVEPTGAVRRRRYVWPRFLVPHAFGFTRDFYVVPELPARYRNLAFVLGLNRGVLGGTRDEPMRGTTIHLVPRDPALDPFTATFDQQGFVYHFTNTFQEGDQVWVDAFVSNLNPEREASQFELDPGRKVWTHLGGVFRFGIDTRTRKVTRRLLIPGLQRVTFDAIDESRRGRSYRHAWFATNEQHEAGRSAVTHADLATGAVSRFEVRDRVFLRQPRFVGTPGAGEGEGFLLVPAYSGEETRLLVFDALAVARGPVVVLGMGIRAPYTNHGCAVPVT